MVSLMRALVFDGPADDTSRTRVAELPVPDVQPAQVLIEVTHAGVNFKDIMVRRGDPGYAPCWPITPGLEIAGRASTIGANVREIDPGDRVVALTNAGGLAEYAIADAELVVPVPASVSLAAACVAPGALTTAELLVHDVARVRPGDVVVVHSAAGAVGAALAELAREVSDLRLIGIVGAQSRTAAARANGYEAVFVRSAALAEEVLDHLSGRRVDVVLDPQGTQWLEQDLAMLGTAGRIVLFGNAGAGELGQVSVPLLYGANASVGGFSLAAMSARDPQRVRAAMLRVLDRMATGTSVGDHVAVDGLGMAADAQQRLADGAGEGKYVVYIRPEE
jgi:NADPH2:quinone reductase